MEEIKNTVAEIEQEIAILYCDGYTDNSQEIKIKKAELLELYQKFKAITKQPKKVEEQENLVDQITAQELEIENRISEIEQDIAILYNDGYVDESESIKGKKAELLTLYEKLTEFRKNKAKSDKYDVLKNKPTKEQIELQNQMSEIELDIAILRNDGYTDNSKEIKGKNAELLELYRKFSKLLKSDSKPDKKKSKTKVAEQIELGAKLELKQKPKVELKLDKKLDKKPAHKLVSEQEDNSLAAQISRLKEKIAILEEEKEKKTDPKDKNRKVRQIAILKSQIESLEKEKTLQDSRLLANKGKRFEKVKNVLEGIAVLPGKALNAIKNRFSKPKATNSAEVAEFIAKLDRVAQGKIKDNPFEVDKSQQGKDVPPTNHGSKDKSKSAPVVGDDGRGGFGD